MKNIVVIFIALCLVSGCDDDSTSNNGNNDNNTTNNTNEMTLEEYCNAEALLASGWCDYYADCCTQEDRDSIYFSGVACAYGPEDPQECVDFFSEKITAGTLAFHGEYAQDCLNAVAAQIPTPPTECSGTKFGDYIDSHRDKLSFYRHTACRAMFEGLQGQGEPCINSSECPAQMACQDGGSDFVCLPVNGQGGPCDFDDACEIGLFCNDETKSCQPLGSYLATCFWNSDCEAGYACNDDKECTQVATVGQNCESNDCEYLTYCDWNADICVSLGSNGASCTEDYECKGRCDSTSSQCISICGGTR